MIVHFEDKDYEFDLDEIDLRDAIYVQNQTSLTLNGLVSGFMESNPAALLGLYWLMMKQNGKTVSMDRVNFKVRKFDAALAEAFVAARKAEEENPTEDAPAKEATPETEPK